MDRPQSFVMMALRLSFEQHQALIDLAIDKDFTWGDSANLSEAARYVIDKGLAVIEQEKGGKADD